MGSRGSAVWINNPPLLEKLDAFIAEYNSQHSLNKATRGYVVRIALAAYLDQDDSEAA